MEVEFFSQNLHMYLSKYLPVFIKILTCIYQNPNLYFLKSVPVFLKIFICIFQNPEIIFHFYETYVEQD